MSLAGAAGLAKAVLAAPGQPDRGEFGASMSFLRRHYVPPQREGESNYFLDLWADEGLRSYALACHLTNNRALFINSHGKSLATPQGMRYACYPHSAILPGSEKAPPYSIGDLARVLGPAKAAQIHNVVFSGCNAEGAFSANEIRQYFVHATNIVHMPAGQLGYQSMFRQLFTTPSWNIKRVYETSAKSSSGKVEYFVVSDPSPKATPHNPYIAELFLPGANIPYRTQTAGREILAPSQPALMPAGSGQ